MKCLYKLGLKLGLKIVTRETEIYYGMSEKKRKPFFQTTVGRILKGAAGTLAPGLVGALDGVGSLSEALTVINESTTTPPDIKVKLRELALEEERIELEAFEAEVFDRQSAREREIALIKAGKTDHMMAVIGWGTIIVFIGLIAVLSGLFTLPGELDREFIMLATGAVFGNMATIVAYFYGSSHKPKK